MSKKFNVSDTFDIVLLNNQGEKVMEGESISAEMESGDIYYAPYMDLKLSEHELELAKQYEGQDIEMTFEILGEESIVTGKIKVTDGDGNSNAVFHRRYN